MGSSLSQARVEDRYFLQKVKLGQGSFGTVWRAVDRQTNQVVAIKQMDKASMPKRGVRRADIEREVSVMQAAKHDNITKLLNVFEDHTNVYFALEYCDGGDFGDKVKERGMNLEEQDAAEWMRQIISAIAALHLKSICHRDIKPDNFMVHGDVLKLADFGLAVFLPPGRLLTEKCGTPAFMAPEQHLLPRRSRGYNNLCDMWAAGVTMYMLMFGGKHPFTTGAKQQMDEKKLMSGTLDFSVDQGFFGFGSGSRFSDPARIFCRRMVEPDALRRTCADDAQQDPWLNLGGRRTPGRRGRGIPAAMGGKAPQLDPRRAHSSSPMMSPDGKLGQVESEAELQKRIVHLEEQVKLQREQNESQWEALMHGNKMIQHLQEKQPELQRKGTDAGEGAFHTPLDVAGNAILQVGTKCRYNSSSWPGWMPAVVEGFNQSDGTYNLDVRQHAKPENISPVAGVAASDAWPPGTPVHYESSSAKNWIPAIVLSFNEDVSSGEGTYNLDVRAYAVVDRMRPRIATCEL